MKNEFLVVLHASHVVDVELQLVATHGIVSASRFQPVSAADSKLLHSLSGGFTISSPLKAPQPGRLAASACKQNGLPAPGSARLRAAAAALQGAAAASAAQAQATAGCGGTKGVPGPGAQGLLAPGASGHPPASAAGQADNGVVLAPPQLGAQQPQQQQPHSAVQQVTVAAAPPMPSAASGANAALHVGQASSAVSLPAAGAAAGGIHNSLTDTSTNEQTCSGASKFRDVFALLRHHVKKNRAQLERVFPSTAELTIFQLHKLVQSLLLSRTDEPPLTARELQHVMALLDVDDDQKLSRAEFEEGLKNCRETRAVAVRMLGNSHQQATQPDAAEPQLAAAVAKKMKALAVQLEATCHSGGQGTASGSCPDLDPCSPMDQLTLKTQLLRLQPDLGRSFLLCILSYLDLWNQSEEGWFTSGMLLAALKQEPFSINMCIDAGFPSAAAPAPMAPSATTAAAGGAPGQSEIPPAVTATTSGSSTAAASVVQPIAVPVNQALSGTPAAFTAVSQQPSEVSSVLPAAESRTAAPAAAPLVRKRAPGPPLEHDPARGPMFPGEHPQWFTLMDWPQESLAALEVAALAHKHAGTSGSVLHSSTQHVPISTSLELLARLKSVSHASSPATASIPTAQDWNDWHSNVITKHIPTAEVVDLAAWEWPPYRGDGWWREQWKHLCGWVSVSLQYMSRQLAMLPHHEDAPASAAVGASAGGMERQNTPDSSTTRNDVSSCRKTRVQEHAMLLLLNFPAGPYRQGQLRAYIPTAQDDLATVLPDLFLPHASRLRQCGATAAASLEVLSTALQVAARHDGARLAGPHAAHSDALLRCSWVYAYTAATDTAAGLGDVLRVVLSMPGTQHNQPTFLEKVEVLSLSRVQPVKWVAHHKALMQPGQELHLQPDPHSWQHWDVATLQDAGMVVMHHNPSTGCFTWKSTPPATMAAFPGGALADHLQREVPNLLAPDTLTHDCTEADILVYLADVKPQSCHVRSAYSLDNSVAQQAQVQGTPCPKAVVLQARGGSSSWQAVQAAASEGVVLGTYQETELVFAQYNLKELLPSRQASRGRGTMVLFESVVGLDDSSGCLPGAVRLLLLADDSIMWRSPWLAASARTAACQVDVSTATTLTLAVESSFAPGGTAVWVDPHIVLLPLQPLASSLSGHALSQAPVKIEWVEDIATHTVHVQQLDGIAPCSTEILPEVCWYRIVIHMADVPLRPQQQKLLVQLSGQQPWPLGGLTAAWFGVNLGPGGDSGRSRIVVHYVKRPVLKNITSLQLKHPDGAMADEVPFLLLEVHADHLSMPSYFVLDSIPSSTNAADGKPALTSQANQVQSQPDVSANRAGSALQQAARRAPTLAKHASAATSGRVGSQSLRRDNSRGNLGLPWSPRGVEDSEAAGLVANSVGCGQAYQVRMHFSPPAMGLLHEGLQFPVQVEFVMGDALEPSEPTPRWLVPAGLWGGSPWTVLTCSKPAEHAVTSVLLLCKKPKALEELLLGLEVLDLSTNINKLFIPAPAMPAGAPRGTLVLVPVEQQMYRVSIRHKVETTGAPDSEELVLGLHGQTESVEAVALDLDATDAESGASCLTVLCCGVRIAGNLQHLRVSNSVAGLPDLTHVEILDCATGHSHYVDFKSKKQATKGRAQLSISLQKQVEHVQYPWVCMEAEPKAAADEGSGSDEDDASSHASSSSSQHVTAEQVWQSIRSGKGRATSTPGSEHPIAQYHLALELEGSAMNGCRDVAESLVMVGADQDGRLMRSLPIDLENASSTFCMDADQRYIQNLQQANSSKSEPSVRGSAHPREAHYNQASYQVEVHYSSACLRQSGTQQHAPAEAVPHVLVALHGSHNSSELLELGPATSLVPGASPFGPGTSVHCFQVATLQAVGSVLRLTLQLPASSQVASMWLERVVVVDPLHSRSRVFPARSPMGCCLEGRAASLLLVGVPRLYLLPADAPAFTVTTRQVEELRSISIRRDRPGTSCSIKAVDVTIIPVANPGSSSPINSSPAQSSLLSFLTHQRPSSPPTSARPSQAAVRQQHSSQPASHLPLAAAAGTASPQRRGTSGIGLTGRLLSIFKPSSEKGDLADQDVPDSAKCGASGSNCSFRLEPVELESTSGRIDSCYGATSSGVPYIRTFWTAEASASGHATHCYMWPVPPRPQALVDEEDTPVAESQSQADHAPAADLEMEACRKDYTDEYQEYQAGRSSIFAVLRKWLKIHPGPLDRVMAQQTTKAAPRGVHKRRQAPPSQLQTLSMEQLGSLLDEALPKVLADSKEDLPSIRRFIIAMVLLDPLADPLSPHNLLLCLKACHTAVKQAASIQRLVEAGPPPPFDSAVAPAESALQQLALKLLGCSIDNHAAFASMDLDSSKVLDLCELAAGARQLLPANGGCDAVLRLVLAYVHLHADTLSDGYLTLAELQHGLAPFVPEFPLHQLEPTLAAYRSSANLASSVFDVLRTAVKLYPSGVNACICLMNATSTHSHQLQAPHPSSGPSPSHDPRAASTTPASATASSTTPQPLQTTPPAQQPANTGPTSLQSAVLPGSEDPVVLTTSTGADSADSSDDPLQLPLRRLGELLATLLHRLHLGAELQPYIHAMLLLAARCGSGSGDSTTDPVHRSSSSAGGGSGALDSLEGTAKLARPGLTYKDLGVWLKVGQEACKAVAGVQRMAQQGVSNGAWEMLQQASHDVLVAYHAMQHTGQEHGQLTAAGHGGEELLKLLPAEEPMQQQLQVLATAFMVATSPHT